MNWLVIPKLTKMSKPVDEVITAPKLSEDGYSDNSDDNVNYTEQIVGISKMPADLLCEIAEFKFCKKIPKEILKEISEYNKNLMNHHVPFFFIKYKLEKVIVIQRIKNYGKDHKLKYTEKEYENAFNEILIKSNEIKSNEKFKHKENKLMKKINKIINISTFAFIFTTLILIMK